MNTTLLKCGESSIEATTIAVPKEGSPMVLVPLRNVPKIAILMWANPHLEVNQTARVTHWDYRENSKGWAPFYVPCACCNPGKFGVKEIQEFEANVVMGGQLATCYSMALERLDRKLLTSITSVAADNEITQVFARGQSVFWDFYRPPEVTFGDIVDLPKILKKHLGSSKSMQQELSFAKILWSL